MDDNDEVVAQLENSVQAIRLSSNVNTSRTSMTAEDYAAESLAADFDEWVTYKPEMHAEPLDEWLDTNRPSIISREDGVGWIGVHSPYQNDEDPPDVVGLQKAWQDLCASGAPITYNAIQVLALGYNVTTGKWLFHVPTGYKIDILWRLIANNLVGKSLGNFAHFAKVSPFDPFQENYRHVICVYNRNYTNIEEVFALEKAIRMAGIKCVMHYKPDVYTYCGIYRKNKWELRPTVYISDYDARTHVSRIQSVHENRTVSTYSMAVQRKLTQ